ncbi:hypothetical protein ABGB17_07230 [Sphaerisporangium sp. B11E5]|uniref:hypothetical protein n=1 Tax=Sphaerisporangium sp. B11E5 TaxID=3153563 RepID=UPI00325C6928
MTTLLAPLPVEPVRFLWGTTVVVDSTDLRDIVPPDVNLPETGPAFEKVNATRFISDEVKLSGVFLAAMNAIARADRAEPVSSVRIEVQGWREGHGIPAAADVSAYIGWCCLLATAVHSTAESGCLSLADPRAGSDLTAMPGLPWGRQILVRPVPGALTVAPGWLTHSVVPLEHGQSLVMAVATCSQ